MTTREGVDGSDGELDVPRGATDETALTPVERRRFLETTAGSAAAVGLAGCMDAFVGDVEPAGTFTIGVLAGDPEREPAGRSIANAAKLAAAELDRGATTGASDEAGGVPGKSIEVLVADAYDSQSGCRDRYRELTSEHDIDATVGVLQGDGVGELMNEIAERETVHVTTGSTDFSPTQLIRREYEPYKYHFRTTFNDLQVIDSQFRFIQELHDEHGWDSVAVLGEDVDWTDELVSVHDRYLPDLGLEVDFEVRNLDETSDFAAIYDRIEEAGVDAAIALLDGACDEAVVQWAESDRPFDFVEFYSRLKRPNYDREVDGACRLAIGRTTATATSNLTPYTRPFVEAYRDRFDEDPAHTGFTTYDAVVAVATAARDTRDLVDGLERVGVVGTLGTVTFSDSNDVYPHDLASDPDDRDAPTPVVFQWQDRDGEAVQEVIWPKAHATASYQSPERSRMGGDVREE